MVEKWAKLDGNVVVNLEMATPEWVAENSVGSISYIALASFENPAVGSGGDINEGQVRYVEIGDIYDPVSKKFSPGVL